MGEGKRREEKEGFFSKARLPTRAPPPPVGLITDAGTYQVSY